jgi:dTMP kinase
MNTHLTEAGRHASDIVPALSAGFVVLADRYIYSQMARATVRGIDPVWIRIAFWFALMPDAGFYLRTELRDSIPRAVFSRGFDYWESGNDLYPDQDLYESFCKRQTALLGQFDLLAKEYGFEVESWNLLQ